MIMKFWSVFLVFNMLMVTPTCAIQLPENMNKDVNLRNMDYKMPNFDNITDSYQNLDRKQIVKQYNKNKYTKNISRLGSDSKVSTKPVTDISDSNRSVSTEGQKKIRTKAIDLSPKIREVYKNQSNVYSQLLVEKKVLITEKNNYVHGKDILKDKLDNFVLTTGNHQVYDKIRSEYINSIVNLEKNQDEINKIENSINHSEKKLKYYKNSLDALNTLQGTENNNGNIKSGLDSYNNNIKSLENIKEESFSSVNKTENNTPDFITDIKSTSVVNKNSPNNVENGNNTTNEDIQKFDTSRIIPLLAGTGLGLSGILGLGIGISTIAYSKISSAAAVKDLVNTFTYWRNLQESYEDALLIDSTSPVMINNGGCLEIMTHSQYLQTSVFIENSINTLPLVTQCEIEFTTIGTVVTIVSAVFIVLAITAIIVYLGMRFGWWKKLLK